MMENHQYPNGPGCIRKGNFDARAIRGRRGAVAEDNQMTKSYALVGDAARAAVLTDDGFEHRVESEWFSAKVDRKVFKQLMKR
jgi:hypothetical protein